RPRARARIPDDAPRHAADDDEGAAAVRIARIRADGAAPLQSGARHPIPRAAAPVMSTNYDAGIYDIATPQTFRGDLQWYRRKAAESGGPVLELGAGTGRVTLPIANDGIAVHALDADGGMLSALRKKVAALPEPTRKRIVVIEGDMRAFKIDAAFP